MRQMITWTDAKTSAKVGIYTTAARLPMELQREVELHMQDQLSDEEQLSCLQEIRETIRAVAGQQYDLRSIRRGALSEMALHGVPLETVMSLSGHTSVKTLMLYIGHGTKAAQRLEAMARATEVLLRTTTGESPSGVSCESI
jgi:class 3 adenylate cyclase